MEEFIQFSAKTKNEAITKACIELGVSSDQLDIEVVSEGSSGFFGIGSKPAIIKARKINVIMDPNAAEDRILASGTLHIFLGELLHLALHYGIRGIRIYLRTKKKGGNRNGTSDQ